jgi:hypothetical protein
MVWYGPDRRYREREMRCVIVSRDITDRKRFEEELFKAEKLESLGVLAEA